MSPQGIFGGRGLSGPKGDPGELVSHMTSAAGASLFVWVIYIGLHLGTCDGDCGGGRGYVCHPSPSPCPRVPPVHRDDLHQLGRKAARLERYVVSFVSRFPPSPGYS